VEFVAGERAEVGEQSADSLFEAVEDGAQVEVVGLDVPEEMTCLRFL
jgi:hypothetical protein